MPDSGKILVDGADITKQKNRIEYFRNKVSFLFQNFALIDNKTVEENLNMVKKNTRTDTLRRSCAYVRLYVHIRFKD